MSLTLEQIESEAGKLSEDEQVELLHRLLVGHGRRQRSPEPEIDRAWLEEAERRSRELHTGKVSGIPAEEVFRDLRKRLG
jgi:putative addiction module component (TIGR02574 family)